VYTLDTMIQQCGIRITVGEKSENYIFKHQGHLRGAETESSGVYILQFS